MRSALLVMTFATTILLTACERHKDPAHTDSANGPAMTATNGATDPSVNSESSSSDSSAAASDSSSAP